MDIKTFFEKFELFADASNAIAKMRELVLQLAVTGKLVPQDPNDEPAARVLERIDVAPKRAMRTRATDEEESGEPTELEPLFELPPGWEWTLFRRLPLQASVGIDRGRSMQGPDKAVGYFKMNNIRNEGGVDLSDLTRIDATPDEIEAFALADRDFLFNTRNSRELVGKTCVFRAPSDDTILYNNNILRVRFIEGFSPDFLDYWFRSPVGKAGLEKLKSNTTNVCAIYQGKLSGFPCAIPPLAEQKRIVAKVDELMALCDRLAAQQTEREQKHAALSRASLARFAESPTPANLEFLFHDAYTIDPANLRQTILTTAVQGKLVPQVINDEPAVDYLKRINSRHALSCNGTNSRKEKIEIEITENELPFAIPDSWVWCRIATIADKVTDGEHLSPVKTTSGMPLLTATHVTARGITLKDSQYVSIDDGKKSRLRCDPKRGDILICSRGTIGRCAVVDTDEVFCLMGSVILARFPEDSVPKYFNYFLSTELAQTKMRGMSGATAVQALYLKDIRLSLIPLPPLAEQHRIVAKVDQLMALVDQLETQLTTSRTTAEKLLEAVVAELTAL